MWDVHLFVFVFLVFTVMSPADIYPLVGENVTMDCELDRNKVSADWNASDLVFIPGNNTKSYTSGSRNWSAPGVQTVVDANTLRLTLTNVTQEDEGTVHCKLKEDGILTHIAAGTITPGGTVYS